MCFTVRSVAELMRNGHLGSPYDFECSTDLNLQSPYGPSEFKKQIVTYT
jgi:hypothetical protein